MITLGYLINLKQNIKYTIKERRNYRDRSQDASNWINR